MDNRYHSLFAIHKEFAHNKTSRNRKFHVTLVSELLKLLSCLEFAKTCFNDIYIFFFNSTTEAEAEAEAS